MPIEGPFSTEMVTDPRVVQVEPWPVEAYRVAMSHLAIHAYKDGLDALTTDERFHLLKWPTFDMKRVPV